LINWPREVLSIGYLGKDFYPGANASFIGLTTIGDRKGHTHESVSGEEGHPWEKSSLRKFLQERVYTALPIQWRRLVKEISQQCLDEDLPEGSTMPTLSEVSSYIYIPSRIELTAANSADPDLIIKTYMREGGYVPWHTYHHSTAKFSEGIIIPGEKIGTIRVIDNREQDPLASADADVKEFDRWSNHGFTFAIKKETLKKLGLAPSFPPIEGKELAWIQIGSIWTRSVNPGQAFPANVNANGEPPWFNNYVSGTVYGHYPVASSARILPCFSI
jgi:hypothetical protein